MNIIKTLVMLLVTVSVCVSAKCTLVSKEDAVPSLIQPRQCFELQGGHIIESSIRNHGTLILKAGRSATLVGSVVNSTNARFIVRGDLMLIKDASVLVKSGSVFEVHGTTVLKDRAAVNVNSAFFYNKGRFFVQNDSQINASDSTFSSTGTMSIDSSKAVFKNGSFENRGTLDLKKASIDLISHARWINYGKLDIDKRTLVMLHDKSSFKSFRHVGLKGTMSFDDRAYFENSNLIDIESSGVMLFLDKAHGVNKNDMEVAGNLGIISSKFINKGNLRVRQGGFLELKNGSVYENTGTTREEGQIVSDAKSRVLNKNIIYDASKHRRFRQ